MRSLHELATALPVRAILLAIAAAAALPTLVFSGVLLMQYADSARARAEHQLEEGARGIARAIDAEFATAEAVLHALSSAPSLQAGDLGVLESRLRRATAETGRYFALIDASGQHAINTFLPPGAPLPRADPSPWGPAFAERRTIITDVVKGAGSADLVVGIGVPIVRDDEVKWVLATRLSRKEFAGVLAAPGVPRDWVVSIVDRRGVHLTRSPSGAEFAGRPLVPELIAHMARGGAGLLRTISLEGIPLVSTVAYAERSGWATAIGLPVANLEAPLRASLRNLLAVGALVFAVAMLLSFVLGRRLDRALLALSAAAEEIGDGHQVVPRRSGLREIDTVGEVLAKVSRKLQAATAGLEGQVAARTAELSAANARLVDEMQRRAAVEEQVRQMQKIEAVGRLTGGIAHDFNNMLAIILGSLRLLQRRLERGETNIRKYVDSAVEGAERAARLTSRLLAFSRQQPLAPEVLDIGQVVAGMSEILRRTIPENIEIETVLAGGLWRAHVDRQGLENVIINLAVNARDAMPGGGKLLIETANASIDGSDGAAGVPPGEYVVIALRDTGCGMSPEVMARAFDPFFTTKPPGDGTGLGLSQVHGFVSQSGGHVRLSSAPGQGATVRLYLPRHAGELAAVAPAQERQKPLPVARGQEAILIVEDEEAVRKLTVEMVADLGYATLAADGGPAALRLLDQHPEVALVITDVVMPGMNGRQLADEIHRRRPGLPILFTTGYTPDAIVHGGILDPGVHLVTKPHTIEALALKMGELLRGPAGADRSDEPSVNAGR